MKKEKTENAGKTTPVFSIEVTENIAVNWPEYWDYHVTNPQNAKAKAPAVGIVEDLIKKHINANYEILTDNVKFLPLIDHNLKHSRELKGKRTGVFFVETVQEGELVITGGETVKTAVFEKPILPRRGRLVVINGGHNLEILPTPATQRNVLIFTF